LQQLQDIPEDESDASDDDIFEPNGDEDEDYEPPKSASDLSSDCDVEDTCSLEEEFEDDVQQQVMPAMNVGQAGCSTRCRGTAREIEEEDEAESQEEMSSWGILLTQSMLAKITKLSGLSLRVGGVHPEDLEATACSGNNQARHHMPHGVSQRTKSLRHGDYSLMIQSFVTSSVAQKLKQ
jgi:hypothetical protein